MSNNHQPYRRHPAPAPTEHTRPSYSSSDNNQHFYRQPLEPSSPLPSQSSSSYASPLLPGSDGALNILRSCGLEPTDLSLLAELPEDALTLDSLPHLLKQIKVRRGGGQTFPTPPAPPSSSSSHPPRSSSRQVTTSSASSGDWDKLRTQPIQYPLDHVRPTVAKSRPLPPEQVQDWQDRWGNPRQTGSVTQKTSSSSSASSSGYVVDYAHKDRAAVGLYDRVSPSSTASAPGESTIKPPSFFSLHVEEYRPNALPQPHEHNAPYSRMPPPATAPLSSQPGVVDYRKPAPPPNEYRSLQPRQVSPYVGQPSSSQKQPSRKAALDFHGTTPVTYPYTCSLCEITVLSEKFWNQHVNAPQHADGQLAVLQQFPDWDCRLDNNRRSDEQPQRSKDEDRPAQRVHPNKKTQQKRPATGKVISAKFVAQSVDETYLRSLVETFGKVVKVILFPSLAFVEMGSCSQARDLVKWYDRNPVSSGQNIVFDHSSTFNFLQSSRVVSFSPAPSGEDNISDLISILKRFGPLLYTLFLPSMAFVEMKFAPDAQKLVDYYSTNILKINDVAIKVFYSGEYNTLMRVPKAKKFEEEEESSGRKKSRSPRSAGRTRSRSPRSAGRTRSRSPPSKRRRSRDKEDREKRTDRERVSSERKREEKKIEADKERNREVEKKRDVEKEREGEKESSERRARSESKELSSAPIKTDTQQPETKPAADRPTLSEPSQPETKQNAGHQEDEVSEEDSDIEGMEVIGEDGDFVDDTDEEEEENGEGQTTAVKEEMEEVPVEQSIATSTEPVEVSVAQSDQQEVPETAPVPVGDMEAESEPDFPIDLSNCITLDELGEETEEEEKCKEKAEEQCTKVLYFKNLPFKFYTDNDFLSIVKGYGKVSRYFLIRNRREGFIEMYSASDAIRAAEVLTSKTLEFNGSVLLVDLSHKYKTLTAGWKVESDSDEEKRDTDRSRSSRRLASKRKRTEREEENRREETGEREKSTKETENENREEKITDEGKENRKEDKIKETEEENREKGESKEEIKEIGEEENREGIKETGEEGNREEIKETGQEGNREEMIKEMIEEENRIETGEEGKTKETGEEEKTKETGEEEKTKETGEEEKAKETAEEEKTKETGEEEKTKETGEEEKTKETGEEENREEILKETGESMQEEKPATSEEVASSEPGSECPRASNKENPEVKAEVKDQAPAEPVQPTKPVGTEFVRPVVGYFCNLCQVIYADEEEAKSKHCSTLQHYNKYQEHTGRDPWTS